MEGGAFVILCVAIIIVTATNTFAHFVLFLALGIIAAQQYDKSFNHYQSESNKYQPDTIAHTIVTIRSDMQFHECSNYCTLRGPDFG